MEGFLDSLGSGFEPPFPTTTFNDRDIMSYDDIGVGRFLDCMLEFGTKEAQMRDEFVNKDMLVNHMDEDPTILDIVMTKKNLDKMEEKS